LQSIVSCSAGKATEPFCFSLLALRLFGHYATFTGTYGLTAVFSKFSLFSFQVLPPWKPAPRCGSCFYPNDKDANFCQVCGVVTAPAKPAAQLGRGAVDEKATLERFQVA